MNGRAFNRAVQRARAVAEALHFEGIRAEYERLIRQAGKTAALNLERSNALVLVAGADWQPPPEGSLFDEAAAAEAARQKLARKHASVVKTMAGGILSRFDLDFDLANPLSEALLENAAQRTGQALGEAVQFELRAVIAESYAEGLAVVDAAERIRARLDETSVWQSEMLARTDLNGLSNGSSVMAAQIAGIETKTWASAADERVRPDHVEANGQTVPITQPFQVCGEELQYPGDPSGSDECVANCRCTVIYGESVSESVTASAKEETMSTTEAPAAVAWVSDVAFEGTATEDGRFILPGSLDWRELPLTLMALTETGPGGHEGAFAAGKMVEFVKDEKLDMDGEPLPDGVTAIRATGIFDMGGENGAEVARLVEGEFVRGVSVDLAVLDWAFRDPETGEIIEPDDASAEDMERAFMGELQYAVRKGTIMAATVCPTPAFADARIVITASGAKRWRFNLWAPLVTYPVDALTAAASVPATPPRDWFLTSELPGPTPLTVTDEGRVYGHIALWDSCHVGFPVCTEPPKSPSSYAYFHTGEIAVDDGSRLPVGKIMVGAPHASLSAAKADAIRHYDDHGTVGAYVRAHDGRHGIWVAGTVRPNLPASRIAELRANPPSGDWRACNRQLDLVAILAVPVPGYPVPRAEAGLVASGDEIEVDALIASAGQIAAGGGVRAAIRDDTLTHDTLTLDDQFADALEQLQVVTELASDREHLERENEALRAQMTEVRTDAERSARDATIAQKQELLAEVQAMTRQVLADRKPRSVRVIRDEAGRAVSYEEEAVA